MRSDKITWEPEESESFNQGELDYWGETDPDKDPDPPGPPVPKFYAVWVLAERLTGGDVFKLSGMEPTPINTAWWTYWGGVARECQSEAERLHTEHARRKAEAKKK